MKTNEKLRLALKLAFGPPAVVAFALLVSLGARTAHADGIGSIYAVVQSIFGGQLSLSGATAGQSPVKQADGSWAPGSPTPTSAGFDTTFGTTQGSLIYRNATTWVALTPGTVGQLLQTGGPGANPSWTSMSASTWSTVLAAGNTTSGQNPQITTGDLLRFGGATASFTALKPNGTTLDLRLADDTAFATARMASLLFGQSGTTGFLESADSSTAAVSGAATGRIRYNNAANAWQVSTQGGAWTAITTGGAFTGGTLTSPITWATAGGYSQTNPQIKGPTDLTMYLTDGAAGQGVRITTIGPGASVGALELWTGISAAGNAGGPIDIKPGRGNGANAVGGQCSIAGGDSNVTDADANSGLLFIGSGSVRGGGIARITFRLAPQVAPSTNSPVADVMHLDNTGGTGTLKTLLYPNTDASLALGTASFGFARLNLSSGATLAWNTRSILTSPADGSFSITNNAATATPLAVTLNGSTFTQSVATSGSPTALSIVGGAHTTLTASTEATDINFNLARTVQFATGALATQRAVRIQAPTYGFVGASTITDAATVSISGAPVAGTNATITNAYALWVQGGTTQLDGNLGLSATSLARWSTDVALSRQGAAGIVGLVNPNALTSSTQLRVYNTTDAASGTPTNYETLSLLWSANTGVVGTTAGGTGTLRDLQVSAGGTLFFATVGANRFQVSTSGHLLASTDNASDIGASGANRPRSLFLSSNATIGGTVPSYNGRATAGNGLSPTVQTGRVVGQTAGATVIAAFSAGAVDSSFEISANVLVTAAAVGLQVQVAYTDEGNNARTMVLPFSDNAGASTVTLTATGPYSGMATRIRCKASTNITVSTVITSGTYNAEADVRWCK